MGIFSKTIMGSLMAASLLWACTPTSDTGLDEASNTEAEAVLAPNTSTWTLDTEESGMTYITVKNGDLAEINTFRKIDGTVTPDGAVEFTISLGSVDTNNEIRDGRMKTILFETGSFPLAKVSTKVDMEKLESLSIGESHTLLLDMNIGLHGHNMKTEFYVLATRLGANKVVVVNKAPLILHADDFGFSESLVKLQKLAGLDTITPVVPVTASLVFTR